MNSPFVHRFLPVTQGNAAESPTLLLLHGTGGNEHDLIPLGQSLAPGANLLSPRGNVLENGMSRFFRRFSEGVFDEKDLVHRTHELADFVHAAAEHYGFSPDTVTALGYSNGANIAASLLLLRPATLLRAILLRAMVPLTPERLPDLSGKSIFLASGTQDPILPLENARRLAAMFRQTGAGIDFHELPASHSLTSHELDLVRQWLATSGTG